MRRRARTSRGQSYPFAASQAGLYTQVALVLESMRRAGDLPTDSGFELCSDYVGIVPDRLFEADVAIPALKICVEYQGGLFMSERGGHQGVHGARRDWFKANEAQLNGWLFLQFGPDETRTGDAANVVERAIRLRLREEMQKERDACRT